MMTMIEEMVRFLKAWPGLAALQGTRLTPVSLGQEPTYPATRYIVVDTPREYSQEGNTLIRPRVQFDCYATTYGATRALAEQLRRGAEAFGLGNGHPALVDGPSDVEEPPELGRYRCRMDVVFVGVRE